MGMAASQARFLNLTARQNNLELQVQQVNQKRTIAANATLSVYQQVVQMQPPLAYQYSMTDPLTGASIFDSTGYDAANADFNNQLAQYNAQEQVFQMEDKKLEMELKNLDTQHQAVQTEIDAVKKVIDKNIDMTFKTFA